MLHPGLAWRTFAGVAAGLFLLSCGDDASSSVATDGATDATGMSSSPMTNASSTPDDDGMTASTPTATAPSDTTMGPMTGTDGDSTTGGPPSDCPYEVVEGTPGVALELVATGCDRPVQAIGHPTEPDRLFVVEQGGHVRIVEPGSGVCSKESFLYTADSVNQTSQSIGNEPGLLGFAFHPDFPDDPRVYVDYIAGDPLRIVIEEYMVDADNPNQVDPTSGRVLIELCKPLTNHNGGTIVFDDTGMLLVTVGDGGPQNDDIGNGRDPTVLLGKVLRIDVEPDGRSHTPSASGGEGCADLGSYTSYGIPEDNPFVDNPDFAPEIYAWGFRNPWRAAWDSETDILYLGDVGQSSFEEVDQVLPGSDQGWSDMEGFSCFGGGGCDGDAGPGKVNAQGQTLPLKDWSDGCSAIGGAVYRSCEVPGWNGLYFYGEYACGGQARVGALMWDPAAETVDDQGWVVDANPNERVIGNGWNAYGDVFITTVDAPGQFINDGKVYRIAPAR